MTTFERRTAIRIAAVSLMLATLASPVGWVVSMKHAEENVIALAMEESQHLLRHHDVIDLGEPTAKAQAALAARTISNALFDIAEIYDRDGNKLADALSADGARIEARLPRHARPDYLDSHYEWVNLDGEQGVLRVFVPLRSGAAGMTHSRESISGYFEGVRLIPQWQKEQFVHNSIMVALMVGLASLACGLALYPVIIHLQADNQRKAREVLASHISMMEALGRAIAKRDHDTGAHNYRVAWIASRIGEQLGLHGKDMQALIAGSFLHDVGKIGIPDAILLKPGKLDEAEFAIMRNHVQQGEEIVTGMGWLDGAREVVAGHHEKWNGSGYPRQWAGERIPLAARIFAVADVFDALCSKRPYKEAMPLAEVMAILDKASGSHFDPAVMRVFRSMAGEIHDRLNGLGENEVRLLLEGRIRDYFGQ